MEKTLDSGSTINEISRDEFHDHEAA